MSLKAQSLSSLTEIAREHPVTVLSTTHVARTLREKKQEEGRSWGKNPCTFKIECTLGEAYDDDNDTLESFRRNFVTGGSD